MVSPKPCNVSATSPTLSPIPTNLGIASATVWVNSPALCLLIPKVLTNLLASESKLVTAVIKPVPICSFIVPIVIETPSKGSFNAVFTISPILVRSISLSSSIVLSTGAESDPSGIKLGFEGGPIICCFYNKYKLFIFFVFLNDFINKISSHICWHF